MTLGIFFTYIREVRNIYLTVETTIIWSLKKNVYIQIETIESRIPHKNDLLFETDQSNVIHCIHLDAIM